MKSWTPKRKDNFNNDLWGCLQNINGKNNGILGGVGNVISYVNRNVILGGTNNVVSGEAGNLNAGILGGQENLIAESLCNDSTILGGDNSLSILLERVFF